MPIPPPRRPPPGGPPPGPGPPGPAPGPPGPPGGPPGPPRPPPGPPGPPRPIPPPPGSCACHGSFPSVVDNPTSDCSPMSTICLVPSIVITTGDAYAGPSPSHFHLPSPVLRS